LLSDEVKNAPQLRIGLINEILPEGILFRVDHGLWKFFGWGTVLLLCRDVTLRWNALYNNSGACCINVDRQRVLTIVSLSPDQLCPMTPIRKGVIGLFQRWQSMGFGSQILLDMDSFGLLE
jgi:hypothetical protein